MAFKKKRYFPKKDRKEDRTGKDGTLYDSKFEKEFHELVLPDAKFHCKDSKVSYSIPHTYEPDFIYEKDGKTFLVETKGRFRDSTEARKYLFIREHLPENTELVFVLVKPNTPFPFAKVRKDGTKQTHEEWLDKNKFRHWIGSLFSADEL